MAADPKSRLQKHCLKHLKRTYELFMANAGAPISDVSSLQQEKLLFKINDEYGHVKDLPPPVVQKKPSVAEEKEVEPPQKKQKVEEASQSATVSQVPEADIEASESSLQHLITALEKSKPPPVVSQSIVEYNKPTGVVDRYAPNRTAMTKYKKFKKPTWHAPWKLKHVIAGHTGWVRCVSVEPGNEWFCTGAADRTIKLWDLATGTLKLTLTGHIATVRGVIVSQRHNYIFSCGEDRMVKCWDLEQNKVIRHYHGHLSGIYSIAMHPTLDILFTGGRDSTCRVWDIRTKAEVHCLSGHTNVVSSLCAQATDPQVITGSADNTIRLWDLGMGKVSGILTNHKKNIRALVAHPTEFSFMSAAADNIKKWRLPKGEFMTNLGGHNAVINTLALNQDNVLVSGADNGSMQFWDWSTGYPFQRIQTQVQPGSLDSEAGILAAAFDLSGARLITCEVDKTIKVWWEDPDASEETHPVDPSWRPNRDKNRF